jgi:hypothetical protein
MDGGTSKDGAKSKQRINLPRIGHSRSLPVVHPAPKRDDFSLRFINYQMPSYEPAKDRFLHRFFERHPEQKPAGSLNRGRKSIKTQPSE